MYVRSMYGNSADNRGWKRLYTTGDFNNSSDWDTAYGWGNHASAGYLTSVPDHSAGKLTSGTVANARLPTDMKLEAAAPRYRLKETGVTNTPDWWLCADGGNLSFRLNNSGAYPLVFKTNAANTAVDEVQIKYNLEVTGAVTASDNVIAYSDERLKENVETLDGSKVYEMRGVSFTKDGKANSGVIAQEMQKVAPELVHDDGEYLGVAYGNTVGYLIEAIKDLKAEVESLKSKLEDK